MLNLQSYGGTRRGVFIFLSSRLGKGGTGSAESVDTNHFGFVWDKMPTQVSKRRELTKCWPWFIPYHRMDSFSQGADFVGSLIRVAMPPIG